MITAPVIKGEVTLQSVFNHVRDHLLKQNAVSEGSNGCLYRDSSGKSCAVGCLIADDLYRPEIEGSALDAGAFERDVQLIVARSLGLEDLPVRMLRMLVELQGVHDHGSPDLWSEQLAEVAHAFHLQP